ncbi:MAG: glutaredoxin family protein [Vicinamibacterales bacterium]|nr:glutaredoxin family protein [Vicinamibacterales bacterium]
MRFVIYSKPGCHLCDEMKAVVRRVLGTGVDNSLEEADISNDPALLERYGLEIPVLMLDGAKVAKYRVTEAEVRRMLRGRT